MLSLAAPSHGLVRFSLWSIQFHMQHVSLMCYVSCESCDSSIWFSHFHVILWHVWLMFFFFFTCNFTCIYFHMNHQHLAHDSSTWFTEFHTWFFWHDSFASSNILLSYHLLLSFIHSFIHFFFILPSLLPVPELAVYTVTDGPASFTLTHFSLDSTAAFSFTFSHTSC